MNSHDLHEKLKTEQSKRLRRDLALTGQQRMERFYHLQALAEKLLAANAAALAAFHHRNRQKRTQTCVRELEKHTRHIADQ